MVADEAGLILFSPVRFVLLVFSLSDKLPLVPLGFVGAETVSPTTYRVLITTDYLSSRVWKKAERKRGCLFSARYDYRVIFGRL